MLSALLGDDEPLTSERMRSLLTAHEKYAVEAFSAIAAGLLDRNIVF